MTLRRTHACDRCGEPVGPGDVFSAVDLLDGEGRAKVLLCTDCGRALRGFLDGE